MPHPTPNRPKRRWWWWQWSLAILLLLGLAVFLGYPRYRMRGLPSGDEPFDIVDFNGYDLPADENAWELYRSTSQLLRPMNASVRDQYSALTGDGLAPFPPEVEAWIDQNREALEVFRRGSARPAAMFARPGELRLATDLSPIQSVRELARLAQADALRLEAAGDMRGAWNRYRDILRASRHVGQHGTMIERLIGIALHAMATDSIVRWAGNFAVDPALLRNALGDARSIFKQTAPLSVPLKCEYLFAKKALDEQLRWSYPLSEPEMSQRVLKQAFANLLSECDRPRLQRPPVLEGESGLFRVDPATPAQAGRLLPEQIEQWANQTPLVKLLLPSVRQLITAHDREQARQELLELALCLQLYHREHGEFPEELQSLVGDSLAQVPADPFGRGEPMRYRNESDPAATVTLWSIGPDGVDDDARSNLLESSGQPGDYVILVKSPQTAKQRTD